MGAPCAGASLQSSRSCLMASTATAGATVELVGRRDREPGRDATRASSTACRARSVAQRHDVRRGRQLRHRRRGSRAPLIERWTGKQLGRSTRARRTASAIVERRSYAVSCATADELHRGRERAGPRVKSPTLPLAERWNGKRWKVVPAPRTVGRDEHVPRRRCRARARRVATRSAATRAASTIGLDADRALERHQVVDHGEPERVEGADHDARRACRAPAPARRRRARPSGSYATAAGRQSVLRGRRAHGARQVDARAHARRSSNDQSNALTAVSCTSAKSCFAVGGAAPRPRRHAHRALERQDVDGRDEREPDAATRSASSTAISCTSATNCVAAGLVSRWTTSSHFTLINRWNGTRWAIESSAEPARRGGQRVHRACRARPRRSASRSART